MLREYWYIAATSREVSHKKPIHKKLLGEELVLWRDSQGVAQAVANTCIHRGVPLSLGLVDGDCVRCPYHGWSFNGAGVCTSIPSNGAGATVPANARTRAYPVQEAGGFVWVYPGLEPAETRRPLVAPIELTSDDWVVGVRCDDIATHYTRVIEHNIDVAHLPWIHQKTIGRSVDRQARIDRPVAVADEKLHIHFKDEMPVLVFGGRDSLQRILEDGLHLDMPNLFRISFKQTGIIMGMYAVPLDDENSRIYQYVSRRWLKRVPILSPLFTRFLVGMNMKILREDLVMLESQRPKQMPEDITQEFHVRADEAQIQYRKLRAAYFARYPHEHPNQAAQQSGGWAATRPFVRRTVTPVAERVGYGNGAGQPEWTRSA